MTWHCPLCSYQSEWEGTCQLHGVPLKARPPVAAPRAPRRLALEFPWSERVEIPADGLEVGRAAPRFVRQLEAYDQISRSHARFLWSGPDLVVEDIGSTNGTYVDGRRVLRGEPIRVRPGQGIRLGEDVDLELVELNDFGEPVDTCE